MASSNTRGERVANEILLTDGLIDRICELAAKGWTKSAIAAELEFGQGTLYEWLKCTEESLVASRRCISADLLARCKKLQARYFPLERSHAEQMASRLDEQTHAEACELARKGYHLSVIARKLKIHPRTMQKWLKWGDPDDDTIKNDTRKFIYECFREDFLKAQADAETDLVDRSKDEDPKWVLERRHPKRWGVLKKVQIEVDKRVGEELDAVLNKMKKKLTPEEYERIITVIAGEDGEDEADE